jgi:rRNA-processing protein FCF1
MKNVIGKDRTEKFIGYPIDNLFGIIDNSDDAETALQALVTAGFANDIQLFHGEEGAHRIDASGAKHGWLAQLRRLHQKSTVERAHAEQYEQAVLQEQCVIAVHTSDPEQRERARQILKAHGGHFINYYGRFGIRQLDR